MTNLRRAMTAATPLAILVAGMLPGCSPRTAPVPATDGVTIASDAGSGTTSPAAPRLPAAVLADSLFWRTLHAGAYDSIPRAMVALKAAYLQRPTDPVTASHVAFLHTWRIAERTRLPQQTPAITDEAVLARYYFDRATRLAPKYDARVHGFAAVMRIVESGIHRDAALLAAGMDQGRESIARWPEFNLFSIGYALSTRPDTSAAFKEALEMQWRALDLCRRGRVSRSDPLIQSNLGEGLAEADLMKRRACYNSWIAPHNIEGFFLNMGDMVLRAGDWKTAQKVYALARQSATYTSWPSRELLEDRIRDAERAMPDFQGDGRKMMLVSSVACSACHQTR